MPHDRGAGHRAGDRSAAVELAGASRCRQNRHRAGAGRSSPRARARRRRSSAEYPAGAKFGAKCDLLAAAVLPAEPAIIEVWRPAGRAEKRPHKPRRPRRPERAAARRPSRRTPRPKAAPRDSRGSHRRAGQMPNARAERARTASATASAATASSARSAASARKRRSAATSASTPWPGRRGGGRRAAATGATGSIEPSASSITPSRTAAFGGRDSSRIPIRLSPSSPPSSSSSSRGSKEPLAPPWIASASTNGCGTRAWCAPAPLRPLTEAGFVRLNGTRVDRAAASRCESATW